MKKIYSIKSNNVFNRIYAKGKSCVLPTCVIYARKNVGLEHAELGITTAKKMGGAVERNRARRIIREAYRLLCKEKNELYQAPYYIVIVARGKCFKKSTKMQSVLADITRGFSELGLIKCEESGEV